MEQESFEDEEVSDALRRDFISIKVDKEERPDVDTVYMEVTHAITGSGGWPMTVLLTPDQKPFFAGTYFPKNARYGVAGLLDILSEAASRWKEDKSQLEAFGNKLLEDLHEARVNDGSAEPSKELFRQAFKYFSTIFDEKNGGFGRAPKFPSPHNLMFIMRYGVYEKDTRAQVMVSKTLDQMYRGGLFDHVGGGFARYSTDPRWLVPHFEKMLYDNALLTTTYLEAYQLTGRTLYRRIAEKTLSYIAREMTGNFGEFYCAQDADSDGREGLYYVWRPDEITGILGSADGKYWNEWYGVTQQGNFEGLSIPTLLGNLDYSDENARIEQLNERVYAHRFTRVKLHKDDKALTGWNAMMIVAYAKAYAVLCDAEYRTAAERAVKFIREKLTDEKGNLRVSYRNGESKGHGFLDDYAFYNWALLSMFDATFELSYLEEAIACAEKMYELFSDSTGFYMYSRNAETLITRPKETYDGAVPSGNSAAAYVLQKLAALTGDTKWEERSYRQLEYMAAASHDMPAAHSFGNIAAMSALYKSRQLICALVSSDETERLRAALARHFLPDLTVIAVTPDNSARISELIPHLVEYEPIDCEATFYMCENRTCAKPFKGFDKLEELLASGGKLFFKKV